MNDSGTLRCGTGWGSECMFVRRTYCLVALGSGQFVDLRFEMISERIIGRRHVGILV